MPASNVVLLFHSNCLPSRLSRIHLDEIFLLVPLLAQCKINLNFKEIKRGGMKIIMNSIQILKKKKKEKIRVL